MHAGFKVKDHIYIYNSKSNTSACEYKFEISIRHVYQQKSNKQLSHQSLLLQLLQSNEQQ